jgi:hypothetical protein
MPKHRPMGIMASFSKVSFKKDGAELFSARVTSGGCFGPDDVVDVVNRGYDELKRAINDGKLTTAALDFNQVSVGAREFAVSGQNAQRIEKTNLKRLTP